MTANDPSPKTIRLVTALLLIATFAAGTITGGALVQLIAKRDPPSHAGPDMGPLPWETLNLTEAQRNQAHAILERYRPRLDAIFDETAPKVHAITDEIDKEVRKLLTPEQQSRFDRILSDRRSGPPGLRPPRPGGRPPGPPFEGPTGVPFGENERGQTQKAPALDGGVH